MAEFRPFDLGEVYRNAQAIQGAKEQSSFNRLRASALEEDMANSRVDREQAQSQMLEARQRENSMRLVNSIDQVLASQDPMATAAQLLPSLQQAGIVARNVSLEGMDLEELKQFRSTAAAALGLPVEKANPQSPQGRIAADQQSGLLTSEQAQQMLSMPADDGTPMPVKEWKYYNALPPALKPEYLEMKRSLQIETIGQVPTVVRGDGTQPLSTLPAEAGAAATIAGAEAGARASATNTAELQQEQTANARTLEVWKVAREGLVNALAGTDTGPLAGRLPAVTSGQQIAEGAVASVAPVLKQLFRSAGEGIFTDRDQALLLEMVPKRTDHPETAKAKIGMIDAIIEAKLSALSSAQSPQIAAQSLQSAAPTQQGGAQQIQTDEQYNALQTGAQYIAPDGSTRTKR